MGLRAGLAIGQLALRREATPFELDILLGALEPTTAPRTAAFITEVYGEAAPRLAVQLRERAADEEQRERAHALFGLLGLREEPKDERSWWDRGVDWVAEGAGELTDWSVDGLSGVPALGAMAAGLAPVAKFGQGFTAGVAKGGGAMVGGLVDLSLHPLDAAMGMATMAEHVPMSPFKGLHKLYDVAAGNRSLEDTFLRNPLTAGREDLSEDWAFFKQLGGAMAAPYRESVAQGKIGEAVGRGAFDVGSLFIGAGELRALGKGAKVANKLDDAARMSTKLERPAGVADDAARVGMKFEKDTAQSTKFIHKHPETISPQSKSAGLGSTKRPYGTPAWPADVAKRLAEGLPPATLAHLGARLTPDAVEALARGLDAQTLARIAAQLDADTLAALLGKGLDGHAIRELADGLSGAELRVLAQTEGANTLRAVAGELVKDRLSGHSAELRVEYLKGKPAPFGGNAAAAELTLDDGARYTSEATSKAKPMDQPSTASMGPDPRTGRGGHYEPTTHADETWVRAPDSEYKILSDLTDQLLEDGVKAPRGQLALYTEMVPCDSCSSVLRQFQQRFPGIRLQVFFDYTHKEFAR